MNSPALSESIVKDAALECSRLRQGYGGQVGEQCRFAPSLTPVNPSRILATLRGPDASGLPKLLIEELSVAVLESKLAGTVAESAIVQPRKPVP